MRKIILILGILVLVSCTKSETLANENKATKILPVAEMQTNQGTIKIQLDSVQAPKSVANFIQYAEKGFYNDVVFHRVIPGFMIQGGGFTSELQKKPGLMPTISNEATNKLSNQRGTISMARASKIDSATSQFFINLVDNSRLDHKGTAPHQFGYAVFGKVIAGMEVVDAIAKIPTHCPSSDRKGKCEHELPPGMRDVPSSPVIIQSVKIITPNQG